MSNRRYPDGPPLDAYSRVTNPERFAPLHSLAIDLMAQLGAQYSVSRSAEFELLPGMTEFDHARPPIRLTPTAATAAPIGVAFTTFPSIIVRCGRWFVEPFPSCGCDACDETAEDQGEQLQQIVRDVVAGRFVEKLTIPLWGQARRSWSIGFGPSGEGRGGGRVLRRADARALRGNGPRAVQWQPWPARAAAEPT